jgi:hypothetical protein
MKTLTDFKKALRAEGTKLEILTLANGVLGGRLTVGMIRFVNIHNTVGVYLKEKAEDEGRGSFLEWGKATEWVFENDVAKNTKYGYSYRVILPN